MISVSGFALRRRDEGGVWPSSSDAGGRGGFWGAHGRDAPGARATGVPAASQGRLMTR
jgi:hypothetical protein